MNCNLNDDLTPEQFNQLRLSGSINLHATWADYLELKRERTEERLEAERNGWTGDDAPDLTEEDEAIFAEMREEARRRNRHLQEMAA